MRRGFTLLELIVVIIILGILATLATTQYTRMIEKSRGAEARIILGSIRSNAAAYYMSNNYSCAGLTNDLVGIGSDYANACANTGLGSVYYFSYGIGTLTTAGFVAYANRCTAAGTGKNPPYASAANITLTTNFATGTDTWAYSAPY